MEYDKYSERVTEYQGESFSKTLYKTTGAQWTTAEGGTFELVDDTAAVVHSGTLAKSDGDLGLSFSVPTTATAGILGDHLLLVHLTDTGDATFKDVIAEYKIKYVERSA